MGREPQKNEQDDARPREKTHTAVPVGCEVRSQDQEEERRVATGQDPETTAFEFLVGLGRRPNPTLGRLPGSGITDGPKIPRLVDPPVFTKPCPEPQPGLQAIITRPLGYSEFDNACKAFHHEAKEQDTEEGETP